MDDAPQLQRRGPSDARAGGMRQGIRPGVGARCNPVLDQPCPPIPLTGTDGPVEEIVPQPVILLADPKPQLTCTRRSAPRRRSFA